MSQNLTTEHAKALYELALNSQRGGAFVHAIRVLEKLVEIDDPFYSPFALAVMSQCYNSLGRRDLAHETLRRVSNLSKERQLLLNPIYVATCYQKSGDLATAEVIVREFLELAPNDASAIAALAEITLLRGDLGEAERRAGRLQERGEAHLQVLGRVLRAFALALLGKHDESARELSWVAHFIISSGNVFASSWDYGDIEAIAPRLGSNSRAAELLIDVLIARKPLPEFIEAWNALESAA